MRSNRLESFFGFTTFGESHGAVIGIVIEDIKPNIPFPFEELNKALSLRKPNTTPFTSDRKEEDNFQVVSGIFEGKTTGLPICILFPNVGSNSADYETIKDIFRPGHADFTWFNKFKIYDYRGGGRASGRETLSRLSASAIVNEIIQPVKIQFRSIQIGALISENTGLYFDLSSENPFCWTDGVNQCGLYEYLEKVKAEKDTVGGIIQVRIDNVPIGLGDPVFEKLNSNLAKALFSIGTIRGVSFGEGFASGGRKGSELNDQISESGFLSNNAGGINGGVSNGQPIIINVCVKPISSHGKPQLTVNRSGTIETIQIQGRHDVCHIPRILPVIESMIKLVLADALVWQKQIAGIEQNLIDFREAIDKLDEDLLLILYRRKRIVNLIKQFKQKNNIAFTDQKREAEINQQWLAISQELQLPLESIPSLLSMVLSICRNDNSDSPIL